MVFTQNTNKIIFKKYKSALSSFDDLIGNGYDNMSIWYTPQKYLRSIFLKHISKTTPKTLVFAQFSNGCEGNEITACGSYEIPHSRHEISCGYEILASPI